ncbi:CBS domain-containing protein [Candidatus Solincola tengchongensis]|uniref:CBS domain-containing protein n=1 Tax=Candidatus Solincola tengchongensis TaxID=2900693 RepID=UPI00257BA218|nr:CBS domain-containing protein [Candidatus Solincola tengchongensis]
MRGEKQIYLEGKVEDVMTRQPVCARVDESLERLVELFKTHKFHGLPVLDEEGRLVGVVRDTDITAIFARKDPASRVYRRVEDIMHRPPPSINLKDSIQNAIMKMFADQSRFLVVTDEEGKMVGVVTRIDLIKGIRFREMSGEGSGEARG